MPPEKTVPYYVAEVRCFIAVKIYKESEPASYKEDLVRIIFDWQRLPKRYKYEVKLPKRYTTVDRVFIISFEECARLLFH